MAKRFGRLLAIIVTVFVVGNGALAAEVVSTSHIPIPDEIEQFPIPSDPSLRYVPTFESIGIYWKPEGGSSEKEVTVRYRESSGGDWHQAMPLWYDARSETESGGHNNEYRGSIVHLTPGSTYDIELTMAGGPQVRFTATTWSEEFPIAETIYLPEYSTNGLLVDRSGSPDGYILYTHAPGQDAVIEGNDLLSPNNVVINGSYIIIRGLTLKGAPENGIVLGTRAHHVIIEDNDISGWGRLTEEGWGENRDAAIRSECPFCETENSHIIIQRNRIHTPRADANSWLENPNTPHSDPVIEERHHPGGANGIYMSNPAGNLVIRYNEFFSDDDHKYNDVIGGASNFSYMGFPNRDTDIYGNIFSHAWDDAIEAEGANMNVRIWGNYIDETYVGIGIAATTVGPLYIWRNVADRSKRAPLPTPGHGPFIKAGSNRENAPSTARTYVFHNTLLQRPAGGGKGQGHHIAIQNSGGPFYELISRNNLFATSGQTATTFVDGTSSCTNDWDYDWFDGMVKDPNIRCLHQTHGIRASITRIAEYMLLDETGIGRYTLKENARGIDMGKIIPNFNDDYLGSAPDVGAIERGGKSLEFGVDAYKGSIRWGESSDV